MSARDRLNNPAPWLSADPPEYSRPLGDKPRKRRTLGLLDAVVVALVALAVWSRTPVGALFDHALAALTGADVQTQPLTAYFDTGGSTEDIEVLVAAANFDTTTPEGGLPQPYRTAAELVLKQRLTPSARGQLTELQLSKPDATAMDVVDALYTDDAALALEVFAVGSDLRDRAIGRARSAGQTDPEAWHVHRSYLPMRARLHGDRVVGRILELSTALDLEWPVRIEHRVTSPFGTRVHPVLKTQRFHNGVDMGVRSGTAIYAAQAGKVRVGEDAVSGKYIVIQHSNGVRTSYCHLSRVDVQRGDTIDQGTPIALSGNTGRSTGPHLHFVVRIGKHAVDPSLLRRQRASIEPAEGPSKDAEPSTIQAPSTDGPT